MAREYSDYQKKVIQRYYENRDDIDTGRLAELVTNLYLSEGNKRKKLWTKAEEIMLRLGVKESRVAHVVSSDDPEILAMVVEDLNAGRI